MDEIRYSVEASVARLVIDRPERRNALNSTVMASLHRALQTAAADPLVRVVSLTGAGDRVFCAGADLKASLEHERPGGFGTNEYRELLLAIRRCPKPTVALARGHVMAGGLGLLLACDLALACSDVYVSTPEINVGMFPMMVMALLFRHVGRKRATEMLLFGERMPAPAARDIGIFNDVYERAEFEDRAAAYVAKLASKSAAVLRLGKRALLQLEDRSLAEELRYLEGELAQVMATEDSGEGLRAFSEKRPPAWKDR